MIAQQIQLQQQQIAANNQMVQQGGNPNQPNPQQLQSYQQAQALQAMALQQQQLQHQAQMQAQMQAQAQAQSQQAQAQAQGQGQGPHQQPNQQQQPGQPPQPNPQQQQHGPNGPGGNIQGPNQGPGPQGNQQQQQQQQNAQQQQQQQNQQQQQQQPNQQQGPSPAQQQVHQAQLQQAQQNVMAHNLATQQMAQQRQRDLKGQCTLKLLSFAEHLSGFPGSKGKDDTQYWDNFVRMFFAENGVFRYTVPNPDETEQSEKSYDITFPALSRYFHTQFDSGVKSIQLLLEKTTDQPVPNTGRHIIETGKANMIYWFEGGSHLVATGTLRVIFDPQQKIESLDFTTSSHEEYISRNLVIDAAKPAHNWVKEWHKVNTLDNKQSPEMSKKGKAKVMKSPQNPPPDLDLPGSIVKQNTPFTEAVHQFLETVEILGQMAPLFQYYHTHPGVTPYSALEQYVNQINNQPQQGMPMGMAVNVGQPGPMQQGGAPRTPSFNQFQMNQMGQSPAQAHQMLPGSPHIGGSPAPGQMQAPSMQLQASQQGTSSSGNPSANTSPSQQNNKRRRPSGVKNEDDGPQSAPTPASAPGGTPQLNGVGKGKPPTPRMPKRVKGNPA
ncbi:LIM-domain binding protein-domain-containing protein [Coniochaeta sp. 2T2.1]|nr:LIM-domain binding protein-domain-containing protein [Coniochaeta sp. 2T2.1]